MSKTRNGSTPTDAHHVSPCLGHAPWSGRTPGEPYPLRPMSLGLASFLSVRPQRPLAEGSEWPVAPEAVGEHNPIPGANLPGTGMRGEEGRTAGSGRPVAVDGLEFRSSATKWNY